MFLIKTGLDQLQEHDLCRVASPGSKLQDPGISAVSLLILGSDLVKELRDYVLIKDDFACESPVLDSGILRCILGQSDELLGFPCGFLGSELGGLNPSSLKRSVTRFLSMDLR